jgi:hypothetical protein
MQEIENLLEENVRRNKANNADFNPITGEGSIGKRVKFRLTDFPIPTQWIPTAMTKVPLIKLLMKHRSIGIFVEKELKDRASADNIHAVVDLIVRIRCRHDFAFWAAMFATIKSKGGGEDVLFRLTRPQRRFVTALEDLRLAKKPIRLVLLKARQWGGSTVSQIYMAWLQLVHKKGLNSLIIAHQGSGSDEIKSMFQRLIDNYPLEYLYKPMSCYAATTPKYVGVGHSGAISRVPQRNCNIKIGTAERPDSCRGGDYNLVHLSEVGFWKATDGKRPEEIVRSACSGVLYQPYTMIVYESTANGTGNFFHREYTSAKNGDSQFKALFIAWYDIDLYREEFKSEEEKRQFAEWLYTNRDSDAVTSSREEPGKYLWWLWEKGATLEAISWYIMERRKHSEHGSMAAEFPSDDIEAFVHSGHRVFDKYHVENLRAGCKPPRYTGELVSDADEGAESLENIRFDTDSLGCLSVWEKPEEDAPDEKITNRYLVTVDVGGRWEKADWSVIAVFDRLFMADGDKPELVAQWYGHCDIDILAWKAARIAKWYNNALLVIESNTVESKEAVTEGDQSLFILNQIKEAYDNLYARRQSEEDIRQGLPRKYGFHTNTATKPVIISHLVKVVREGTYIERDEKCLNELINYERKQNGSYGAIQGEHDDLLMTRAIGLYICFREMELPRIIRQSEFVPIRHKAVSAATI